MKGIQISGGSLWTNMQSFANQKQLFDIRIMPLLADAGSREVGSNKWEFNWELFDRFIKFFIDRNAVKSLSCCSIINPVMNVRFCALTKTPI